MSETTFPVGDANAVKLWSKMVTVAERNSLEIDPLIGEDANSIIQEQVLTSKNKGDKITYNLRSLLQDAGKTSGQIAQGNGEGMSFFSDSIVINELGNNVVTPSENTIDAQRVPFDLRRNAKDGLGDWWAVRKSVSFFNQVCGFTAQTDSRFTGLNPVTAPSANRKVFAGSQTADEGISSPNTFVASLIDIAVERAKVGDANQIVRPLMIQGKKKYVMYLHTTQVTDLRTNSAANQWADIAKFASSGVDRAQNPIYNGALGEWNGVILRESQDVTQGVNSSTGAILPNVRRAVLLGAQAAMIGYGMQGGNLSKYRWSEELFDHGRILEIWAGALWGFKKTVYNGEDFGTVTVSTYGAAH